MCVFVKVILSINIQISGAITAVTNVDIRLNWNNCQISYSSYLCPIESQLQGPYNHFVNVISKILRDLKDYRCNSGPYSYFHLGKRNQNLINMACNIMAEGFRFMPLGLVKLKTFRLSAWVT